MATTEQLVRINAPQLATATDRTLYASTPRRPVRASREVVAQRDQVLATASRVRSWILVAMIVVSAIVAAALVGHTGPEVVADARVVRA
jgi:hypothetical protein